MTEFCTGLIRIGPGDSGLVVGDGIAHVALKERFANPFQARPSVSLFVENVNGQAFPFPSAIVGEFTVRAVGVEPTGFTLEVRRKCPGASLKYLAVRYMARRRCRPPAFLGLGTTPGDGPPGDRPGSRPGE